MEATSGVKVSDFLFIIPNGVHKGYKASSRIIGTWLVKTIAMAYKDKGFAPPERITSHFTRRVSMSCKVATWSSMHTFV